MSIRLMAQVWETSKAEMGALLVLLAIADEARDEGECYPSIARLAKKARMTERNVQLVLKKLEEMGELQVIRGTGRGHPNQYIVKTVHNLLLPLETPKNLHQLKGENFSERVKSDAVKGEICDTSIYVVNRIKNKGAKASPSSVDKSSEANPKDYLPPYVDRELWETWMEIRKSKKAINSDRALKIILKELAQFQAAGFDCNAIIKRSIVGSWTSVYAPDGFKPTAASAPKGMPKMPEEVSPEVRAAAAEKAREVVARYGRKPVPA